MSPRYKTAFRSLTLHAVTITRLLSIRKNVHTAGASVCGTFLRFIFHSFFFLIKIFFSSVFCLFNDLNFFSIWTGGFGRLGHAEQKDEMVPRAMKFFDSSRGVRSIFCGSTYSLAVNEIGVLYLFGQNKKTGEANMYPKPVQDLSGWHITSIGCSNTSVVISADDSLIAWGASPTYGELVRHIIDIIIFRSN